MDILTQTYQLLDALLIAPYRWPGNAVAGFYLGTALLALWCVVLGEVSMALAYRFNRRHYTEQTREMVRMHNLSVQAIRARDKASYKASNRFANEWFGRAFFARAALFAVSLWPAPFALGWLAVRFSGVDVHPLPFTDWRAGYGFVFILVYIVVRMLFSRLKPRIPFFATVLEMMKKEGEDQEILSWADLGASATPAPDADAATDDASADTGAGNDAGREGLGR